VYGLPEVYGDRINAAKLVANPGCHPQPPCLGVAPLLANGLIEPTGIIIDSKTGISGGGRDPKKQFHFPECNESVAAYGVGTHRHTPEIEQVLSDVAGRPVSVIFTPHLVPMDRGIFSTVYATPTKPVNEGDLIGLYRTHFAGHPFVRVRTGLPATKDTTGTNYLDVAVKVVRGRVLVLATADNLVRGASGVAVQNFNRMFGFDETTALV
jgi:N-acetyl-gamma-glutamyl-phosphate reductase